MLSRAKIKTCVINLSLWTKPNFFMHICLRFLNILFLFQRSGFKTSSIIFSCKYIHNFSNKFIPEKNKITNHILLLYFFWMICLIFRNIYILLNISFLSYLFIFLDASSYFLIVVIRHMEREGKKCFTSFLVMNVYLPSPFIEFPLIYFCDQIYKEFLFFLLLISTQNFFLKRLLLFRNFTLIFFQYFTIFFFFSKFFIYI